MTYRWYINITQCKGASKKETWWRSRKIWWIHPYVDVYLVGHSPRLSLRKPRYHRWLHLRYFRDGVAFRVGQAYVEWWFISKPTLLHFIIQKTILSAYLSQVPCSYLCWDMLRSFIIMGRTPCPVALQVSEHSIHYIHERTIVQN